MIGVRIAAIDQSQGRYSEAAPRDLRALEILMAKLGENHPNMQTGWGNFRCLLQQAIAAGQAEQLSQYPITQDGLAQIQQQA